MAEGFARRLAEASYQVFSAGTAPKGMHPLAVRVMQEAGIDITAQYSKGVGAVPLDHVEQIITLCAEADEQCPTWAQMKRRHWPVADPAAVPGTEEEVLTAFRKVRDEIRARVEELFAGDRP
jgi:arsenate reductase